MAGVPCEQLPVRADVYRLLSVGACGAYDPSRRDNPTDPYDDAACYDYNDPAGNHNRSRDYYNDYDYDDYYYNDNHNGGEFLR